MPLKPPRWLRRPNTARGSDQATNAATTAQTNSAQQLGQANNISSLLVPTLENQLANPQGINPADQAAIRTSNMQGAGGSTAAAVGQGALSAARTRNAGAPQAATAAGVRGAGEQLSQGNLETNLANQKLKESQRAGAQSGLEGLYGTALGGGNQALGQVAPLVQANTGAANESWDWAKDLLDPTLAASAQVGAAALGGCWIAEAIYGTDDPRTHLLRFWLNGPFSESQTGAVVMVVYRAIGQPVAWVARRSIASIAVRAVLKPLFESALRRACV